MIVALNVCAKYVHNKKHMCKLSLGLLSLYIFVSGHNICHNTSTVKLGLFECYH